MAYNNDQRAAWNKKNSWDAALDALRTQGLTQRQFSNVQGGNLPGGMHGMFLGMNPDMLKKIASFVNPQGTAGDSGKVDPITGQPIPGAMHFSYNDPRTADAGETSMSVPPWMQALQAQQAGGILPGRTPGGGVQGGPRPGNGPQFTGMGAQGYGRGLHGMAPGAWRGQHQGNGTQALSGPIQYRAPGQMPWQRPQTKGPIQGHPILGGRGGSFRQQLIANAMANAGVR